MSSAWVRREQAIGGVVGDQPALAHEQQPVAAGGLVHHVAGDEHGGTGVGQPVEGLPQLDPQHRVETDGRLVEHQQARLVEQGHGQGDPRALAARELGRPRDPARSSSLTVSRHCCDPVVADTEDAGEEAEVLGDRQVVVHAGLLGDVADLASAATPTRPVSRARRPCPPVRRCTPTSERISVVLPQPDGPSRPVTSPAATWNVEVAQDLVATTGHLEGAHLDGVIHHVLN